MALVAIDVPVDTLANRESATWQDSDFAINAEVRDLLVRFRGIGGENNHLLIFERIDPENNTYSAGVESLADEIIRRIQALRKNNDAVDALLNGKTGIGIA